MKWCDEGSLQKRQSFWTFQRIINVHDSEQRKQAAGLAAGPEAESSRLKLYAGSRESKFEMVSIT